MTFVRYYAKRMIWLLTLWLVSVAPQDRAVADAAALFEKAPDWSQFLDGVKAQREQWTRNAERATVPPALAERMERAASGLRLLVAAEDWCVDSANIVPFIKSSAGS